MQAIELHAARIRFRSVLHRHHFLFEGFHALAHGELRRGREQHHQYDAEGRSTCEAAEIMRSRKPSEQEHESQKNPRKV